MPTANPRISVTLTPSVASVLREIGSITGNSQSAMVGELLEANLPTFERMLRVLQAAEKVKQEHTAKVAEGMAAAQTKMEAQLGLLIGAWDEAAKPILDAAERIDRRHARADAGGARAARAARRAPKPPMSNRGVTPHPTGHRKARKA